MNPLRFILLAISLPLLLGGCGEKHEGVNWKELNFRDGYSIAYLKDAPYTGKVFELFKNGQKRGQFNYKNGKKEGPGMTWHKNGQKAMEANYKDDKIEGLLLAWDVNGDKRSQFNYKDGRIVFTKWWNSEGKLHYLSDNVE